MSLVADADNLARYKMNNYAVYGNEIDWNVKPTVTECGSYKQMSYTTVS